MNVQLVCDAPGIKRLLRQEEGRELSQAMVGIVACFEVILMGANNIFF